MSQILDASMPNKRRWEPQAARLLASHIAFDIMFFPGWLFVGIILGVGIFTKTSIAIHIVFNIMIGLSMTSFSIFGGAFFRKAQLSGILNVIASLLLGVLAQSMKPGTGAVAILGLLFPPMNCKSKIVIMRVTGLMSSQTPSLLYSWLGRKSNVSVS
jgi:ATP-binding cassette, subfamily A (ABC1), member 3